MKICPKCFQLQNLTEFIHNSRVNKYCNDCNSSNPKRNTKRKFKNIGSLSELDLLIHSVDRHDILFVRFKNGVEVTVKHRKGYIETTSHPISEILINRINQLIPKKETA